ncbi:hypothetical protein ABZZ47_39030 [Streptomyces sp. NPDC006465]|uniref:hypothetical protein n=1 Tax=Streptomyces sp. NPDC006465 TaxID=3157174 RepID=UPI0033B5EB61
MIVENDPAEQEKPVKWNSLLCNLIVFHILRLAPTQTEVRRRFLCAHPGHVLDSWPLSAD